VATSHYFQENEVIGNFESNDDDDAPGPHTFLMRVPLTMIMVAPRVLKNDCKHLTD
jgi:hypothetical protein